MSLGEEIKEKITGYMNSKYDTTDANVVPDKQSIGFGPKAKNIKHGVILYADIRGSRDLLSNGTPLSAARAHKSFLYAVAKCTRNQDGKLRSFSGDSVMAFYMGENAAVRAVRSAMKIKGAVVEILNPILENKTGNKLNFGIGIAQGNFLVVKSGVAGEEMYQDLIWIGWPTYHAFEYGDKARSPKNIWLSKNVFNTIKDFNDVRYSNSEDMWVYSDDHSFSFGKVRVYKTSFYKNVL